MLIECILRKWSWFNLSKNFILGELLVLMFPNSLSHCALLAHLAYLKPALSALSALSARQVGETGFAMRGRKQRGVASTDSPDSYRDRDCYALFFLAFAERSARSNAHTMILV